MIASTFSIPLYVFLGRARWKTRSSR